MRSVAVTAIVRAVNEPVGVPPIVPVIDTRYAVGLNAYQNRWIHTTRGVGNIIGIRVNCRPELSLLLVS